MNFGRPWCPKETMGYNISLPQFLGRGFVPFYEGPMLFRLVPVKIAIKFEPAKFKRSFCASVKLGKLGSWLGKKAGGQSY